MREIKFRGKTFTNEWCYGTLATLKDWEDDNDEAIIIKSYGRFNDGSASPFFREWDFVDKNTVGQFTGLFDVDLKGIYEGDIVEWTFFKYGETEYEYHLVGVIAWAQGGMIFRVIKNDFEDAGYYAISSLCTDTESDCKVLGNIHDNKIEDFK